MSQPNIRCLIVDDEPHARDLLEILLKESCPGMKLVGKAIDADDAYEKITVLRPDVVFLDIRLKSKTAFDLLNRFESIFFQVVFTTAYDHYALKAFDYSALHYLMKPIDVSKLEITVKRLESRMLYLQHSDVSVKQQVDKIAISTNNTMEFVEFASIEYLSAEGAYTCFHLKDGTTRVSSKILGHYQGILDTEDFCRTHRKFIVNTNCIARIDKGKNLNLVLSSGRSVQVSPVYKEHLQEILRKKISF